MQARVKCHERADVGAMGVTTEQWENTSTQKGRGTCKGEGEEGGVGMSEGNHRQKGRCDTICRQTSALSFLVLVLPSICIVGVLIK